MGLKVEIVELSYYLQPLRAWVVLTVGGKSPCPGSRKERL